MEAGVFGSISQADPRIMCDLALVGRLLDLLEGCEQRYRNTGILQRRLSGTELSRLGRVLRHLMPNENPKEGSIHWRINRLIFGKDGPVFVVTAGDDCQSVMVSIRVG